MEIGIITLELVVIPRWTTLGKKKQCKDPNTKPYQILRSEVVNPMLVVKINFALSIEEVEPFL